MSVLTIAVGLSVAASSAVAHESIDTGPNGGRILAGTKPAAELFVTKDRKVQITFLNDDKKPVAVAEQIVTVTAGDRAAPTKLTFVKKGDVLVSENALPAGNEFPTVVQIKQTSDAKAAVTKFNLNLEICEECSKPEYACVCKH